MSRGRQLIALTAPVLLLAACGGSSDDGGGSGGSDRSDWRINNKQTAYEDVYFTDDEVSAGLQMMEQDVVVPGGEANGRDASSAKCWMVVDDEGLLRQLMWCGPLVSPDGLDEWAPYPFGSEPDGDGQVITPAPLLREQVGTVQEGDTLRRPDGAEPPESGRPGAAPQLPEQPESSDCEAQGTVTYQDTTLDLAEADYLDIETSVDESQLSPSDSATQYIVTHEIRFWDDDADAGHVVQVSSVGPTDGPYQPRSVTVNPYLQTREQMESGAGASQTLSAPTSGEGTFEINGTDGAHVVATASRETFSGAETADLDLTLTCD